MSTGILIEAEYKAKHNDTQNPMYDILSLLQCLMFTLDETTLKRLHVVISAIFAMSGRVTMKNIARWAGKGGAIEQYVGSLKAICPGRRCYGNFSVCIV
ncbi:MAG: hypothetical protein AAGD25_29850 [Cyanobacteria bacterium P01_F01_bin.150]